MPKEVYADTANYTIEWDGDINAVVHRWTEFTTGETYREGCNALLDAIRANDATKMITDTSEIQAHNDEDKAWLQEEWIPKMLEAGVEHTAQVHSESAISKMESKRMTEDVDGASNAPFVTDDMSEARDWISNR